MKGDLLDLLEQLDAPPLIAPMRFTLATYPLRELARTRDAWLDEHGAFGSVWRCHLWSVDHHGLNNQSAASGHAYTRLEAWLGCAEPACDRRTCAAVGGWVYRAACEPCGWSSDVLDDDHAVVAAWHDHAWPGWRDLPVVDRRPSGAADAREDSKRGARWVEKVESQYPAGWGRPGAPVVTARADGATRDMPNGSPWGGFDLAHTTVAASSTGQW